MTSQTEGRKIQTAMLTVCALLALCACPPQAEAGAKTQKVVTGGVLCATFGAIGVAGAPGTGGASLLAAALGCKNGLGANDAAWNVGGYLGGVDYSVPAPPTNYRN